MGGGGMRYNEFRGLGKASRLGFGLMRLPMKDAQVDEKKAIALIRRGIDGGITYLDTAYPYHGGQSEVTAGKALKDGYREKVTVTDKLPCWAVKESADMDRLLDEQLRRLDLPYVDMYLLHALNRGSYDRMKELGYKDFFRRALTDGRVKHVGFSFHDGADAFRYILDDYDWEMCQIQYNYLDDEAQATEKGLLYAGEKGVPVVIMEPLRGGSLARVPAEIAERMEKYPVWRSPAEWACGMGVPVRRGPRGGEGGAQRHERRGPAGGKPPRFRHASPPQPDTGGPGIPPRRQAGVPCPAAHPVHRLPVLPALSPGREDPRDLRGDQPGRDVRPAGRGGRAAGALPPGGGRARKVRGLRQMRKGLPPGTGDHRTA